jgi:hypothetical protein
VDVSTATDEVVGEVGAIMDAITELSPPRGSERIAVVAGPAGVVVVAAAVPKISASPIEL